MKLLKPFISKFDNIFEGYNAYFIITDDDLQTFNNNFKAMYGYCIIVSFHSRSEDS